MARPFLVSAAVTLLAACGGGGGGGGNNGGTAPFALSESSALEAGAYAMRSVEESLVAGLIPVTVALQLTQAQATQQTATCGPGGATQITMINDDRDGSLTVTRGDTITYRQGDCFGISRDISFNVAVFDPQNGAIDGRVQLEHSIDPPGFALRGSFELSVKSDAAGTRWRATDVSLAVTSAGSLQSVRIGAAELQVSPGSYELTATGGSVDSSRLGGSYSFATSAPLQGDHGRLPASGSVQLSTASGSRVSFTPPTARTFGEATLDYAVAAPGGGFGAPQQGLWTALLRGDVFSWRPNTSPTLTNLEIQPSDPSPGSTLHVSYNVADSDGDPLTTTVTWRRNGAIVGNNATSLSIPTQRNDTIEVTVSVTDGRVATPVSASTSVIVGNRGPTLTSLSLTPDSPDTTMDLVVEATASDPENDPLRISYVWRRNDVILPAYTTAVLPASETTRGDTISVTVTVDDNGFTVWRTIATSIVDAPPRVALVRVPASAVYGVPVDFTATATDPDGDPIGQPRFEIAHGPAGMEVDPSTGHVTWTPAGPMFDGMLNVNWAVMLDGRRAQATAGTIRVEDATRLYPLFRTGIQIPVLDSLRVGDFDADTDTEMLLVAPRSVLEIETDGAGGYRQSWAYPFALDTADSYSLYGTSRTLTTGDVDGDGRHEIFVTSDSGLAKLDGIARRVVATAALEPDERCLDIEYGDIDRDGAAEIVCAAFRRFSSERLVIYRASDLSIRTVLPNAYGTKLALGNVDADAALEIVTNGGYVLDGVTLATQWQHPGHGLVAVGNVDGTGPDEIVTLTEPDNIAAYRAGNATPLFSVQSGPDTILVADIAGDARAEVLTGDNQWGNVTAYRYDPGSSTPSVVFQVDSQEHGVSAFGVGDVDRDGEREIVWGSGLSSSGADKLVVASLNPGITIEWTNTDPQQIDGPFIGGAPARSLTRSAAPLFLTRSSDSGYSPSRLVRVDPGDGTIDIGPTIDTLSGSRFSMLAIDDYDADGTDEALLAGSNWSSAQGTAYDYFAEHIEWTPVQYEFTAHLVSANVLGDAREELIWQDGLGRVSVLNVATQQVVWQSPGLDSYLLLRTADLDGDGEIEIVAATTTSVHVYERVPGQQALQQSAFADHSQAAVVDVAVGDVDSDGRAEIFVLSDGSNPARSEVAQYDDMLQTRWGFTLPWRAQAIRLEESAFTRNNLLVSRTDRDVGASRLATVDPNTGAIVNESPPLIGVISRDSVHYVAFGSGPPRLSIGTESGMYLTR